MAAYTWEPKACPCKEVQRSECHEHGCEWESNPSLVPEDLRRYSDGASLVQRLRQRQTPAGIGRDDEGMVVYHAPDPLCQEAANELEANYAQLLRAVALANQQSAEIERLRGMLWELWRHQDQADWEPNFADDVNAACGPNAEAERPGTQ